MTQALLREARLALRSFARTPGWSALAIVTLALGIAGSVAIFSFVNALILRPLPFPHPDRLVLIFNSSAAKGWPEAPVSHIYFDEWRRTAQSFESVAAWTTFTNTRFNLVDGGEPESVQYAFATADLFPLLGVAPSEGRAFLPAEDQPGGARVVVLSHGLFMRRFGGDRAIVGRSLVLDGNPHTVVGVLPAGFRFLTFPAEPDLWLPLGLDPSAGRRFSPGTRYLGVIARLKPGVDLPQARAEMDATAERQARQYPATGEGWSIRVVPLGEQVVGGVRRGLFVLLGAIGLVLLIACANVANLLLARGVSRRRELAVRAALGASRGRLAAQMLIESLVLAACGGILGLVLALWAIDLLARIPIQAAGFSIPYAVPAEAIGIDARVATVAFLLTLLAAAAAGLAPALRGSRVDLNETLKDGGPGPVAGSGGARLRSALVVAEIALSLVLLVGAGLMTRSFLHLMDVDPGFRPEGVMTAEISLPRSRYADPAGIADFYGRLLERLRALPGVRSAAATSTLPLGGADSSTTLYVEGRPIEAPAQMPQAHHRTVSADYFGTMDVPLVAGRAFEESDDARAGRVAIVNETMARRLWPGQDAVGRRAALDFEVLRFHPDAPPTLDLDAGWRVIVGVVGDVRQGGPLEEPRPELYVPYRQAPVRDMAIVVRSGFDPAALAGAIRREVLEVDRGQPLTRVRTMQALVSQALARPRFSLILLGTFAATALVLALVGIYGVVSYAVGQRSREIGIRIALGARGAQLIGMILGQGLRLVLAGLAIGIVAAVPLARLMGGLLFGVGPADPATFACVAVLLLGVSLLASWVPARRATRVDPIVALRSE